MKSSYTARLIATAIMLSVSASAISTPASSAIAHSAGSAYPAAQATPAPFEMPTAPGEADVSQDTGAGRSASTVDMAPGETGTDQQDSPE